MITYHGLVGPKHQFITFKTKRHNKTVAMSCAGRMLGFVYNYSLFIDLFDRRDLVVG